MPTQVFDDVLDLRISLLEASLPERSDDPSYPYPRLTPGGEIVGREFRVAILENDFLKLVIVPALGGRILSVLDKRTGVHVLPVPDVLECRPGGRRGAVLPVGLELTLDGVERLSSLGTVEIAGDSSSEGIWVGESVCGNGLSFHLHISLPEDRAEIRLEARILNRTLAPVDYNGGILVHSGEGSALLTGNGIGFYDEPRDAGFVLTPAGNAMDGASYDGSTVRISRFDEVRVLEPRQVDTFAVSLVPVSRLGSLSGANDLAAVALTDREVRVQSSRKVEGYKLLLLTADGQTLEAPADLDPVRTVVIDVSGLSAKPVELAMISDSKMEMFRVKRIPRRPASPPQLAAAARDHAYPLTGRSTREELVRASFDLRLRPNAHLLLGMKELASQGFGAADLEFEQALLFNAEDPLTWWIKALTVRLKSGPGGETPELLNAHYLAPLEPALRSEAFLSQSAAMGKEPNSLLIPLEANPEVFVEVAAMLVEAGLDDQATRWIDEAIRHQDMAMLRYLQAFCFLRGSRMQVEAAECAAAAGRIGFTPPLPWRTIEWEAIAALRERFPDDAVLARYATLRVTRPQSHDD